MQEVTVVIVPREQRRQEPGALSGGVNALVRCLSQSAFSFFSILCDPEGSHTQYQVAHECVCVVGRDSSTTGLIIQLG